MSEFEKNLQEVEQTLSRFRNETLPHFINGKTDSGRSGKTFESVSPTDNSVIGKVAAGNAEDIDAACSVAEEAFNEWRDLPGKERKRILHNVADGIEDNARKIALVESYDSGQPLKFYGESCSSWCRKFSFLRRYGTWRT